MFSASPCPEPADAADQRGEEVRAHCRVLNEMVELGAGLVRLAHRREVARVEAATAAHGGAPGSEAGSAEVAVAYERITRSMRRSVMLVQQLRAPPVDAEERRRVVARKRIVRAVEDAIGREVEGSEAEALQAELLERMEGPDVDDDIGERPVADIIREIQRDLGLDAMPGMPAPKRRTPGDVAALRAVAAGRARGAREPGRAHGAAGPAVAADEALAGLLLSGWRGGGG